MDQVIELSGGKPGTLETRLVRDLITSAAKLIADGRDPGELKLITAAVKEMRYAYRVFARYAQPHKVTIFGSARTPDDHPDFSACVEFSKLMAERGWMSITGAGGGIMKAGHVGTGREASFGVAIRLPFEQSTNTVIAGDEKLIHFRYFFTRKLMFLSQAEAVALFPGGFGTFDEAFETLTLVQTGKSQMIPIVCLEGPGGSFWQGFLRFVKEELLARGFISPEDLSLFHLSPDPADAVEHIVRFYRNYHSSRYVKDDLVIRLQRPLSPAQIETLNAEFGVLVKSGVISARGPYPEESDALDLPRIAFTHTRSKFGLLRRLIDRINGFDAPPTTATSPAGAP
ncbi:MAG: LOG family protein [Phycisphaeraceae bacterium]|nr:MAG: LOG family protein [Phycisphaeraceae bacterium]